MPVPPEDDRKPPESPDPELNPMTNNLLAQNMGRWAEVYFTTPVEKRDEAVQELLRELRTGAKPPKDSPSETISASDEEIIRAKAQLLEMEKRRTEANAPQSVRPAPEEAPAPLGQVAVADPICPACLSKNKVGQRFCGLCGFSLSANSPRERSPESSANTNTPAPPEQVRAEDDWSWLQERNLSRLAYTQPKNRGWKYLLGILVIAAACLGGYWWWRANLSGSPSGDENPGSTLGGRSTDDASSSSGTPVPSGSEQTTSTTARPRDSRRTRAAADTANSHQESPGQAKDSGSANRTDESGSVQQGSQELEQARAYLEGRGGPKDSSAAAKWLWKSVAKKNPEAAVILSQMYVSGDGVEKSCDQARLLLRAAAHNGSTEAQQKLKDVVANCR